MWTLSQSRSLSAVHLSNNDIPNQVQKSLLNAFCIQVKSDEDLFDSSEPVQINKFKQSFKDQERQQVFIPLEEEITTKEQAVAKIANAQIISHNAEKKTRAAVTTRIGIGRSHLVTQPLTLTRVIGHRELIFNESKRKAF